MSTTRSRAQLLWIKNQLEDYNIHESKIPIYCDHKVAISLSKNPIFHSRDKHKKIRHHFIRDHVQNEIMDLQFVPIDDQLADIFTKPLTEEKLILLRNLLGMMFVNELINFYASSTIESKDLLMCHHFLLFSKPFMHHFNY